jgi:hypothetical protein
MYKIAVITPIHKNDYLTDTVLDGLLTLADKGEVRFTLPDSYVSKLDIKTNKLTRDTFKQFAEEADLVLFCWGKNNTDYELAEEVNKFSKTVFLDGSEIGRNGRLDREIQERILSGTYEGPGKIVEEMLKKCALYFRREKPYKNGIIPFPFGIEKKYVKYEPSVKKDIDFVCIFGQEEFPPLRKEVRLCLEEFCKREGFSCVTKQTKIPFFDVYTSFARNRFYKLLARAKVGISVSGSGFDTARFWEILGNNCMLLTEKIDIYEENSPRLKYDRIWEFKDINEFKIQLEKFGNFLRNGYDLSKMQEEYRAISSQHSGAARVSEIIETAKRKGII